MKPLFRSIRWQIQIWYSLLLFVIVGAFGIIAGQLTWINLLSTADHEIRESNSLIIGNLRRSALADPNLGSFLGIFRANSEIHATAFLLERLANGQIDAIANLPETFSSRDPGYIYFGIFDAGGNLIASTANAPESIEFWLLP
ncbi:MAG: hypothetical protein HC841_03255, partial [Verrucomicrobiae bacterium]|nr:hypothetical protein [Verrucomicrobiae bacterium]